MLLRRGLRLSIRVLPLLALGCSEPLTAEECGSLLDQYVALLAASDHPGTSEADVFRMKLQAREKASRDPAFRRCATRVSRGQFDCAMRAEDADRFEQCLL